METPLAEAQRLIAASGLNQIELAEQLTKLLNRSVKSYTISRISSGSRDVKADELDALRRLGRNASEPASIAPRVPRLTDSLELIPLYAARGPSEPLRLEESNVVGHAPIHPAQKSANAAFAFVVPDDRIADRLMRGETGYALRGRDPLPGQMCLVETEDGAFPYIYEDRDERTLFVRVRRPKEEQRSIPLRDVKGLHVIVGATYGIV